MRHRRSERVPQNPTPPHKSYPQIDLLPACTACNKHTRSETALPPFAREDKGTISDIGPGSMQRSLGTTRKPYDRLEHYSTTDDGVRGDQRDQLPRGLK